MAGVQFRDSRNVVIGASGTGEVRIGPGRPGEQWNILAVSVQTSTATLVPHAKFYRGKSDGGNFISETRRGDSDYNDTPNVPLLNSGEFVTVRWEGADVGATAIANFTIERITNDAMA